MRLYRDYVIPYLVALGMRGEHFVPYRERVVSAARGRVLEVGVGSGENLRFYGADVGEVIGLEPAPRLVVMAQAAARRSAVPARIVAASAEAIPLDDASIDSVVMTWTLCSVRDPCVALAEIRRVLKPDGRLLFAEHGLAPDRRVRGWQHRLTPCWRRLAGGCHLDRDMADLIARAGFAIERLDVGYMRGPRLLTFMYEGMAAPRPSRSGEAVESR